MGLTLTSRAPVGPCDFYTSREPSAGGSVFADQLAYFFIDLAASETATGFNNVMVIRYDAPSTSTVDYAGLLYMYAGFDVNPSEGGFIRMEDNGDYPLDYYLGFVHTNGSTEGPAYPLWFNAALGTGHGYTGSLSDQDGWITVKMGSYTRYLPLYQTKA